MITKTKRRLKKVGQKEKSALEYERFLETAKKLGADHETTGLGRVLRRAVTASRARRKG